MGYFANSTCRKRYEKKYCSRCVHCEKCPVMAAHTIANYQQFKYQDLRTILDLLIPINGGVQKRCSMFYPKSKKADMPLFDGFG